MDLPPGVELDLFGRRVFAHPDTGQLHVLRRLLVSHVGPDQTGPRPGNMRLAWLMRTNVKTVKRLVRKLNWCNLLSFVDEGGRRPAYKIDFEICVQLDKGEVSFEQLFLVHRGALS